MRRLVFSWVIVLSQRLRGTTARTAVSPGPCGHPPKTRARGTYRTRPMALWALCAVALLFSPTLWAQSCDPVQSTRQTWPDFSAASDWQRNGAAAITPGAALLLTGSANQNGSAFFNLPQSIDHPGGWNQSFSASFRFRIASPATGPADGIAFVLQSHGINAGTTGRLGLSGLTNSLAIEFDPRNDGGEDNNDGNHVGLDSAGNLTSIKMQAESRAFDDATVWQAWVDYDGLNHRLEVRWSQDDVRPLEVQFVHALDLSTLLSASFHVGFTASTPAGAAVAQEVLSFDWIASPVPVTPCGIREALTFEGWQLGQVMDDEYSDLTIVTDNQGGGPDVGIIFDSLNPTGGDSDLGSPFPAGRDNTTGLGNAEPGNLLIIHEQFTCDANLSFCSNPDDEFTQPSGYIQFDFATPITLHSLDVFDIQYDQSSNINRVRLYDAGGERPAAYHLPYTGDRRWDRLSIGESGLTRARVHLAQGGALDRIVFERAASNRAPLVTSAARTVTGVDLPYVYTLSGFDADGDAIAYQLLQGPAGLTLNNNQLQWTPNTPGYYPVQVEISDPYGNATTQSFTLAVILPEECGQSGTVRAQFADFSDLSGITLNGQTALINPVAGTPVLRLTDALQQSGSAFLSQPIPLTDEGGFRAAFSAAFSFRIHDPEGISDNDGQGADGIVFIVQTVDDEAGGSGGGIGYQGLPSSVGIEFDTWNNGSQDQGNGNHVGVDIAGNVTSVALVPVAGRMNDGNIRYAWVDYDGEAQQLQVRLSESPQRPANALIEHTVDLPQVLGQPNAFIGFSSGTGAAGGDHDLLNFEFVNTLAPIGQCNAPMFTHTPISQVSAGDIYQDQAQASDADAGDILLYSLLTSPASMSIDGASGQLLWPTTTTDIGDHPISLQVTDSLGLRDMLDYTLSVLAPPNGQPIALGQNRNVAEDNTLAIALSGTDPDGDPITFILIDAPLNGGLSGVPPNLTYTPNPDYHGPDSFTFKVNDGQIDSMPATVAIQVDPVNDAPFAPTVAVATDEDSDRSITLSGTDVDGDTLSFAVITPPTNGTLAGTPPNLTYTPGADFNGADTFAYVANDGLLDSSPATVDITINSVNDAPIANPQAPSVDENLSVAITLSGGDVDGDPLTFAIVAPPSNGVLSGTAPNVTYTPNPGFDGSDNFTFTVNDGIVDSLAASVDITVHNVNAVPTAQAQSVTVAEEGSVPVILTGTDADGDPLTFVLDSAPSNGSLSGSAPNLSYTPVSDYFGADSFAFHVNDGQADSAVVTVTIDVTPVNDPPSAQTLNLATNEDSDLAVVLSGTDVDGDTLSFAVITPPTNGTLAGTPPNLTYTPGADFNGADTFAYVANDGLLDSSPATVDITINSVNDAPIANPQAPSVDENLSVAITLSGSDVDGDPLTFAIVAPPSNGVLSGTAPNTTYTPNPGFDGSDNFTFTVNDGIVDSLAASVDITVNNVNAVPTAQAQSVTVAEEGSVPVTLTGTDADGDPLTFVLDSAPSNGSLSGSAPNLSYTPVSDYFGADSFAFHVNDGQADSTPAVIDITVTAVNDAPTANDQALSTDEDTNLAIALSGSDIDGDTLSFAVATPPANGSLSGSAPNVTYIPGVDFNGTDQFTYVANDGLLDSSPATVAITVNSINDAPVANGQSVSVDEGQALPIALTASDVDGDTLSYAVVTPPANGTLSGTTPNITYTPNGAFFGSDSLTFIANDGLLDSAAATIDITVNEVNGPPTITSTPVITAMADTLYQYAMTATDPDSDPLTFGLTLAPTGMTIDGTTGLIEWTPTIAHAGLNSVSVQVTDPSAASDTQSFDITVDTVNLAPQITSTAIASVNEGSAYAYPVQATDPNPNDTLSYSLDNAPNGMSIDANSGLIAWQHGPEYVQGLATPNVECRMTLPAVGQLNGVLKWHWETSTVSPNFLEPANQLLVAQTNDDNNDLVIDQWDNPDVIFAVQQGASPNNTVPTILRIVDGLTGVEIATTDEAYPIDKLGYPAVGDIDNDGLIEIVAASHSGPGITVFEHDGSLKYQNPAASWRKSFSRRITLADLQGDGSVEIIAGDDVLDANGNLLWSMSATIGDQGSSSGSALTADMDGDGALEIIAGPTVYNADGSILWRATAVSDGEAALADFDNDGLPDVVVYGGNRISVIGNDGSLIWGPINPIGVSITGAPTVADFDGDGQVEMAISSTDRLFVLNHDGSILWESWITTTPGAARNNAASAFDFDADGAYELVFSDAKYLSIYRGRDGEVLWQTQMAGENIFTYPVIADLDQDGEGELIAAANQIYDNGFTQRGIYAFDSSDVPWAPARGIWNQHAYNGDNIDEAGSMGTPTASPWLTHNTFRASVAPQGALVDESDLSVHTIALDTAAGSLSAIVRNRGRADVLDPIAVAFYHGDPAQDGLLLGNTSLSQLAAGAVAEATVSGVDVATLTGDLYALVDPDNTVFECLDNNNSTVAAVVAVTVTDSEGLTDRQRYSLSVENSNDAPTLSSTPGLTAQAGEPYQYQLLATDVDLGDALRYELTQSPPGMAIGPHDGHIGWIPSATQSGDFNIAARVYDLAGAAVTQSWTINVTSQLPTQTNAATDFWLAFNINAPLALTAARVREPEIMLSALQPARGMVEVPGLGIALPFELAAGELRRVILPFDVILNRFTSTRTQVADLGIHISSDQPIGAYALDYRKQSSDGLLVMPTYALGSDYILTTYPGGLGPQVAVVATEDNTQIQFTATADFRGLSPSFPLYLAGDTVTIDLNRGEVWSVTGAVEAEGDFSGSRIVSNLPVAVFAGNSCTNVPSAFGTCDKLVEQMLPLEDLGQRFVNIPLASRGNGDTVKVTAPYDNTVVLFNGQPRAQLDAGQSFETIVSGPLFLEASQPVQAFVLANGSDFDAGSPANPNGLGDPALIAMPPAENFIRDYLIATPATNFTDNFVNILIPAGGEASLTIDGQIVDTSGFIPVANSGYIGGSVPIAIGSHRIRADQPFGLYVYGFEIDDSYGYLGGAAFGDRTQAMNIVLNPTSQSQNLGDTVCLDAQVLDTFGAPVPFVNLAFALSLNAQHNQNRFVDQNGEVTICYDGLYAGIETVTASLDAIDASAQVDWQPSVTNHPPTIISVPVLKLTQADFGYPVTAIDPDGDPVSYSLIQAPGGAQLNGNVLSWTPDPSGQDAPTEHTIAVRASDPGGLSTEQTFVLTVVYAPRITTEPPLTILENATYRYLPASVGGDPDSRNYQLLRGGPEVALSPLGAFDVAVELTSSQQPAIPPQHMDAFNWLCRMPGTALSGWAATEDWFVSSLAQQPVVGYLLDTNGDTIVDNQDDLIIVGYAFNKIVALDALTGAEQWQYAGSINRKTTLAIGDADNDGTPEIYFASNANKLNALNADGSHRWESQDLIRTPDIVSDPNIALSLVDIDGDGTQEILAGPSVFNVDGSRRWQLPAPNSTRLLVDFAFSHAFDLDGDGTLEVLFRDELRDANGNPIWRFEPDASERFMGHYAVANFDADSDLEIVLVADYIGRAELYLLEPDGSVIWGPEPLTAPGLPHVVDVDLDGFPEIFIGREGAWYDRDGQRGAELSLTVATTSPTWNIADVNDDGVYELFGMGANRLYTYDAQAGLLLNELNVSFIVQAGEIRRPLLIDVEGDGFSELLVANNQGLRLFRPSAPWSVSNHDNRAYLRLPATPGTFFDVAETALAAPSALADLWVSGPHIEDNGSSVHIAAEIANRGTLPLLDGAVLEFFDGEPGLGGQLLGSQTIAQLGINSRRTLGIDLPRANLPATVVTQVTSVGGANECEFGNNLASGHTIELSLTDNSNREDRQLYTLNILDPSEIPQITSTPVLSATELQAYSYQVSAQDNDIGDSVFYRLTNGPTGMTIDPASGLIQWTPQLGDTGNRPVALEISDLTGNRRTQSYTIAVQQATNLPPTITSVPPAGSIPFGPFAYDVDASDPDGDVLTYSLTLAPAGMTIDAASGLIQWTPPGGGVFDVTVTVSDPVGNTDSQNFTMTVTAPNSAPSITTVPEFLGVADVLYQYAVDASDPEGDAFSFSLLQAPIGMTIDAATGLLQWLPGMADVGVHSVQVAATDAPGLVGSQTYTLLVTDGINNPPFITTTPGAPATADALYSYDVDAQDADGDVLSYALTVAPAGMTIDAASGLIQWTPSLAQAGNHDIAIAVSDGRGGSGTQSYSLAVGDSGGAPPEIISTPPFTAKAGRAYRYPILATDADGDTLSYSLSQAPTDMTIDPVGGLLTWTPGAAGIVTVTARVEDGRFYSEQSWTIEIAPASAELAVFVTANPSIVDANEAVTVTVQPTGMAGAFTLALDLDGTPIPLDSNYQAIVSSPTPGQHTLTATLSDDVDTANGTATFTARDPDDVNAPTVTLISPDEGAEITTFTDILGSVQDDDLTRWFIAMREKHRPASEFIILAEGTTVQNNAVLAVFDPTLLQNGQYEITLQAEDLAGHVVADTHTVRVTGDLKLGHFSVTFEDLSVPVAGLPITVSRTYDTRQRHKDLDFGFGWSIDYQNVRVHESRDIGFAWQVNPVRHGFFGSFCVEPNGDPIVTVTLPDGEVETFKAVASPSCNNIVPEINVRLAFEPLDGTDSTLEVADLGLLRIVNGNLVDLNAPNTPIDPQRYRLTTAEGFVFELDQGFTIDSVTEPSDNVLTFTADGISHDNGFALQFVRNLDGRISQIIGPENTLLTYSYDLDGNLASFTDQIGNTTVYTYVDPVDHFLEDIFDARGIRVARNEYDADGRLIAHIDAEGHRIEYTHDIGNSFEIVTDRRGNPTTYGYDAESNVLTETNALGETIVRTYDADRNELSRSDALMNATVWTYDERGNQLTQSDPLNQVTASTYNDRNQLLTQADPSIQTVITNTYFGHSGVILTSTDALNNTTNFHWDSGIGSQCSSGASLGVTDALGQRTTIQPNCFGPLAELPLWEQDAQGKTTWFEYDAMGRRTKETVVVDTFPGHPDDEITTFEYDAKGNRITVTDPLGNISRTEYNAIDQVAAEIDALGNRTEFEYDNRGNLMLTRYPDGTTETTAYDPNGNVIAQTDRAGRTTQMLYDAANRLIETVYPDATPGDDLDNPRTRNEYDAAGRLTASIDERGNRAEFEYDAAGQRSLVRDALLNETTFEYDSLGNRSAVIDARGHRTAFVYDAAGRLIETVLPDATPADNTDNPRTFTEYDALGRKTAEIDPANLRTEFEYDALGNLTAVIQDATGLALRTEYTYDQDGNKTLQRDAELRETTWTYDALGRVLTRTLPGGQTESFTYDANGNRTSRTDFNGTLTTYAYDNQNRLIRTDYPDATNIVNTYTLTGQLDTVTDQRGVTDFDYDERDRLVKIAYPGGGTIDYSYDAAGNRIGLTTVNQLVTYGYDDLNRLQSVTDDSGTATYSYDANGNRAAIDYPNGTTAQYVYDEQNRLIQLTNKDATDAIMSQHSYLLGPTGNRLQMTEASGRVVDYVYDELYRLTDEIVTDATNGNRATSWTYDDVGNRLTQVEGSTTTTYTYDVNDRIQSEDNGTTVTTYFYDANGNTIEKRIDSVIATTYSYDFENRLTDSTTGGTSTAYVYDATGIRQRKVVDGVVINFLVDPNRDYAQVIEERDLMGNADIVYTYGDDLINQQRTIGGVSFYHYDGLGSTRALSDSTGTSTDTYIYTAFGETEHQTGTTPNLYLYTGEQFDPNLGFYYLRARYYDPSIGRFPNMDTFMGIDTDPRSLHKYLYTHADPINNIDPSGHFTLSQVTSAINTLSTLFSIAQTGVDLLTSVANGEDISFKAVGVALVTAIAGGALVKALAKVCKKRRECAYMRGFTEAEAKVRLMVTRIPNSRLVGRNRVVVISGAFDVRKGRGTAATNGKPVRVTAAMQRHYAKFGAVVGSCTSFDKNVVGRCAEQRAANNLILSGSRLKNIRWTLARFVNEGPGGFGQLGKTARYCGNCQTFFNLEN